jgi:hypothetical protein
MHVSLHLKRFLRVRKRPLPPHARYQRTCRQADRVARIQPAFASYRDVLQKRVDVAAVQAPMIVITGKAVAAILLCLSSIQALPVAIMQSRLRPFATLAACKHPRQERSARRRTSESGCSQVCIFTARCRCSASGWSSGRARYCSL